MVAITGRDRQAVAVSETTALLGSSKINYADVPAPGTLYSSSGSGDDNNDKEKPLPKFQILLLCYARAVEPLAFFSIFPYVSQMVKDNGNVPDSDIGFYSGLIESMFSLTQAAVMIFWGQAADRFGRKPVLVFSLFGVAVATGLFGLAKTIPQMIAFRCLAGVFAGTIVTIRTMVSEHSTPSTQARAFSWFAFSGNLGLFLGPLLGGALADPVRQYPGIFGAGGFFEKYPYALSSFVVALIGGTAALSSACFIKETLKKEPVVVDREAVSDAPIQSGDLSTKQLLKSPGVGMVLYTPRRVCLYASANFIDDGSEWCRTSCMASPGIPPLQKRIGSNGVIRLCASLYPFFFLSCPLGNVLLRIGTEASVKAFWIILPFTLVVGCGVSMSFTAIQLLLNDVSPSPQVLGTLNALAMTGICGLRAFNPALFTTLFALGARTQLAGGHAIWILMFLLASGLSITTKYLPESNAAVKRQNSQAR
ncbi:Tetracycline resistance protein TetA/multidrug resistance protein MdtG [Penicillium expansum]|nr:Tetracycline resistance protein TetA/multidrug resistance protein MdtG [Penicillium expansum]